MTRPSLALHSYSMRLHYLLRPDYDVHAFIDDAVALEFDGVNISLSGPDNDHLPPNRHLGGDGDEHLKAVRDHLDRAGLSLELDTASTDPGEMETALATAQTLGACVLRTFTHHPPGAGLIEATRQDLQQSAPVAEAGGVIVALENHEEFTAAELVGIVDAINSPSVRLLFDYGNGLPVLEEPADALRIMGHRVASCHMKDCVVVRAKDGPLDVPCAMGVPLGQGEIDLDGLSQGLRDLGLARFTLQNVWGYHVPFGRLRPVDLGDPRLGHGSFAYAVPDADPSRICFDPEALAPEVAVAMERAALATAMARAREVLAAL